MTEEHINAYEGLFLFPQAQAGNLQVAVDHLKDILSRAKAELVSLRKWDRSFKSIRFCKMSIQVCIGAGAVKAMTVLTGTSETELIAH